MKDAQAWWNTDGSRQRYSKQNTERIKEVSGTLQNGIQVKEIYSELNKCYIYSSQVVQLASQHPQYAIFGVKASQKPTEQSLSQNCYRCF